MEILLKTGNLTHVRTFYNTEIKADPTKTKTSLIKRPCIYEHTTTKCSFFSSFINKQLYTSVKLLINSRQSFTFMLLLKPFRSGSSCTFSINISDGNLAQCFMIRLQSWSISRCYRNLEPDWWRQLRTLPSQDSRNRRWDKPCDYCRSWIQTFVQTWPQ